jgi:hypothetical protein
VNRREREAWNARQPIVKVSTFCERCRELKEDVKERESWWLPSKITSCAACFTSAVDEERERNAKLTGIYC